MDAQHVKGDRPTAEELRRVATAFCDVLSARGVSPHPTRSKTERYCFGHGAARPPGVPVSARARGRGYDRAGGRRRAAQRQGPRRLPRVRPRERPRPPRRPGRRRAPGPRKGATFPTISAVFRSCRLIFGRATISKRACFSRNTRARNAYVEASSHHPFRGPGRAPGPAGRAADAPARLRPDGRPPRPAAGHRLPGPELQGVGLAAGAPGAERERGLLALSLRRPRATERDGHARAAQARTRTASSGSTRSHPSARGRRRTRAGGSSSSTTSTRTTATTRRSAAATRRRASPWTTRTRTRRRRPWTRRRRRARPRTRRRRSRPWSSSACPSTPRGRPRRRRAS